MKWFKKIMASRKRKRMQKELGSYKIRCAEKNQRDGIKIFTDVELRALGTGEFSRGFEAVVGEHTIQFGIATPFILDLIE